MTALDKRHDEIESQLCLKAVFHAAQELMVRLEKNVSLSTCQFNYTLIDNFILTNAFNSKLLIRAVHCGHKYTTKGSFADLLNQIKVIKCDVINLLVLAD